MVVEEDGGSEPLDDLEAVPGQFGELVASSRSR